LNDLKYVFKNPILLLQGTYHEYNIHPQAFRLFETPNIKILQINHL
jgi:hypothetical protein